ncbi:hypothetical protein SGRA_1071 [Saprospira grandis str. Lewin]|uniref:Uncharacterized protein n=1 Tax=Saprospira grandis (strain Lewin) TaxID=984262 RepID=H6L3F9_SAPGL|nr:hypothetical protein SGRA_1071 [Saprospira grandis str. Lewin]
MRKGAAKPQTKAVRPQGRADLRALKRSADDRREAEAPKNQRAATTRTLVRLRRPKGVNVAPTSIARRRPQKNRIKRLRHQPLGLADR